jgi:hypothetical protein
VESSSTHTDVTAIRPDLIIKNKKDYRCTLDRCGNTRRQECHANVSGEKAKIQQFMYRDTTNVEHEMYDYTGNGWSH